MALDPSQLDAVSRILAAFGWPAIVAFAWRLSGRLTAIETTLKLILTNHLPHIEAAIKDKKKRKRR